MEPTESTPIKVREGKDSRSTEVMPAECPPGAHRRHQDVDTAELRDQLRGQRPVSGHVVGVVVLVRAVSARHALQQLGDALAAGPLPAAVRVRARDLVDVRAERRQQPQHRRLHAGVGHDGDRMTERQSGQSEPQGEGAAGGLDDRGTGREVPALAGLADHVQTGAVLDAAEVRALEFGVEAAAGRGEGLVDPQERGAADQLGGRRATTGSGACAPRVSGRGKFMRVRLLRTAHGMARCGAVVMGLRARGHAPATAMRAGQWGVRAGPVDARRNGA